MVQSIQSVGQASSQVPVEPVQGARSSAMGQAKNVQLQKDEKTDEVDSQKGLEPQVEARSREQKNMDSEQQQNLENVKAVRAWDVMA